MVPDLKIHEKSLHLSFTDTQSVSNLEKNNDTPIWCFIVFHTTGFKPKSSRELSEHVLLHKELDSSLVATEAIWATNSGGHCRRNLKDLVSECGIQAFVVLVFL